MHNTRRLLPTIEIWGRLLDGLPILPPPADSFFSALEPLNPTENGEATSSYAIVWKMTTMLKGDFAFDELVHMTCLVAISELRLT